MSGIPVCTIRKLIRNNDIPHIKIGNKYYVNADMFNAYIRGTGGKKMEEISYSSMSNDELRKESVKLADDRIAYFDRKIPEISKNPWLPKSYIDKMLAYQKELHAPGYREEFAEAIYQDMVAMIRRGDLS